jgi:hypothetical protein
VIRSTLRMPAVFAADSVAATEPVPHGTQLEFPFTPLPTERGQRARDILLIAAEERDAGAILSGLLNPRRSWSGVFLAVADGSNLVGENTLVLLRNRHGLEVLTRGLVDDEPEFLVERVRHRLENGELHRVEPAGPIEALFVRLAGNGRPVQDPLPETGSRGSSVAYKA